MHKRRILLWDRIVTILLILLSDHEDFLDLHLARDLTQRGDHIQHWLLKLATASLFLAYMISQQVTFLYEQPFKFILQSKYFPFIKMVQGQCLHCTTYIQIKLIQCQTSSYLLVWHLPILIQ